MAMIWGAVSFSVTVLLLGDAPGGKAMKHLFSCSWPDDAIANSRSPMDPTAVM
jgi:hypothetical protein